LVWLRRGPRQTIYMMVVEHHILPTRFGAFVLASSSGQVRSGPRWEHSIGAGAGRSLSMPDRSSGGQRRLACESLKRRGTRESLASCFYVLNPNPNNLTSWSCAGSQGRASIKGLCLVLRNFANFFEIDFPSHQILRHMHRSLNIGKKITNYTFCL
jgi:hypothetical protein